MDVEYHARVRCYKALLKYYPHGTTDLILLNLSMRMAGPREALQHAIIRQNEGCTHFVIGRDHAGPSTRKKDGTGFYGPLDAHKLVSAHLDKLHIKIILSEGIVYEANTNKYYVEKDVP